MAKLPEVTITDSDANSLATNRFTTVPVKVDVQNHVRNCSCNSCQGQEDDVHVFIDQVEVKDPDRWLAEIDKMAAESAAVKDTGGEV